MSSNGGSRNQRTLDPLERAVGSIGIPAVVAYLVVFRLNEIAASGPVALAGLVLALIVGTWGFVSAVTGRLPTDLLQSARDRLST